MKPNPTAVGRLLCLGTLLLVLGGCKVGPDYHPRNTDMPADWTSTQPASATQPASTQPSTQPASTQPAPNLAQWWTTFNDPELTKLVSAALEGNLDLQQAKSRIRQARANRGIVGADFWPGVNADGSAIRSGNSAGASNSFRAGFDATWELDIFGGVRRNIEASEADFKASVEDLRDVQVTLAAEIATNYVTLRTFQRELDIARETLVAQERSVEVTTRRQQGGFVSSLDVANAQAQVASTNARIPSLEAQEALTIYSLSVLLGKLPLELEKELSAPSPLPVTPPPVPLGLPSDLLRRRPDIRAAEGRIHSATARVGVATADLFPKFSLTGSLGLQSEQLSSFTNLSSRYWSFGPTATWPIFDAGRIRSNIKAQNEVENQAVLTYRQAVLTSMQDVQSALVSYDKERTRHEFLIQAVAANRKAVDISNKLYTMGQTDFLNVLSAQQSLFGSQDALAQSHQSLLNDTIALYKALGGGWESAEDR